MSSDKKKTDWGLRFYLDVLKLESLHLGLWDKEDSFTVEGMQAAQRRYTEELLKMIPSKVKTVLDAGCGTGTTSVKLLEEKYEVEVLNPDPYQKDLALNNLPKDIVYHQEKFEEYSGENKFDLILMSESSQYMDTSLMAEKAYQSLNKEGYLLVADYLRKSDTEFYKTCKIKSEFLNTLKEKGFKLEKTKDITEATIPTLSLGKKLFNDFADPILKIIVDYMEEDQPRIKKVISFLASKKLAKVNYYLYEKMPDKLNEDKFRENMEYLFLLFKKS